MPYCIYLRKSRKDIELLGNKEDTLGRHKSLLLDFAKKHNLEIRAIYEEVVSGDTISDRPVMQILLSEVEDGKWEGVLVVEVERLARGDTIDQGIVAKAFKYSNTSIITPQKTYHPSNEFDEEYFEFGLFMSRREYVAINRRLQRGRIASVMEGKFVGSCPPYGYQKVKLNNQKGFTLQIIKEEAEIVEFIFEWYTKGYLEEGSYKKLGMKRIADKLNEKNILPKKSGQWSPSTIRGILTNPVYIGKIRWNFRPVVKKTVNGKLQKMRPRNKTNDCYIIEGIHEPIIDDTTWQLAQDFLKEKYIQVIPRHREMRNPLAGLLKCNLCGKSMIRKVDCRTQKETIICVNSLCKNIGAPLKQVEYAVVAAVSAWLEELKLSIHPMNQLSNLGITQAEHQQYLKTLTKEKQKIQNQMNRLYTLVEQGVYSENLFLTRIDAAKKQLSALEKEFSQLDIATKRYSNKKLEIPLYYHFDKYYYSIHSVQVKNEILHLLIKKIDYLKTVNGRWNFPTDNFQLKIIPNIF